MNPADLAMKNALFEGAAHRSRDVMPTKSAPQSEGYTSADLTTFERQPQTLATIYGPPLGKPLAPRLTLHQFRKQQLSPVPTSPPDLDYKRVRRKPSFASTGQVTSTSTSSPLIVTSSVQPAQLRSLEPLLPSLLPPSPLTPAPRLATSSPSLSSTVDTLPSTPSHTPLQHWEAAFGRWGSAERGGASEPVRTKRKLSFKQAKRLPHPEVRQAGSGGSNGIWQVHAAIIDFPTDEGEIRDFDGGVRVTEGHVPASGQPTAGELTKQPISEKRGRSVRFKEESTRRQPDQQSSEAALTSSHSLSNFKFPAPPGHHWTGTFGHLTEPTPPTSPATVHYHGASFDLLNPHASLLLGPQDFETPAEIDGLLDDYFDNPQEMSEPSLNTSDDGSRRGRQLYDTPNAARRHIMRIENESRARAERFAAALNSEDGKRRQIRSSSVYPHSQISDQFNLTISEPEDEEASDHHLEPESTVTNLVGHYQYDKTTAGDSDDEFVDVPLDDEQCPSSTEIFRGLGHAAGHNTEGYGTANVNPNPPRVIKKHRLSTAPISQPPKMKAPMLPETARTHSHGQRFSAEFTDLPTSETAYGNTGDLLHLNSPGRAHGNNQPLPTCTNPVDQDTDSPDDSFPQLERWPARQPDVRTMLGLPPSASSLNDRLLAGGNISPTPNSRVHRVSALTDRGSNHGSDWVSDVSEVSAVTDFDEFVRQSLESYANTSTNNSHNRLSYPHHPQPQINPLFYRQPQRVGPSTSAHEGPEQATGYAVYELPETTTCQPPKCTDSSGAGPSTKPQKLSPVFSPWQAVAKAGDESLARKILEDKLMSDSIMGHMGYKSPRQDREAKRADVKQLEVLRQKNPSAFRSAVEKTVEAVKEKVPAHLTSIFATPNPSCTQRPGTAASDTHGLIQHAATPPSSTHDNIRHMISSPTMNDRPMVFSPTMNSFTTSPNGTITGSPRAQEG